MFSATLCRHLFKLRRTLHTHFFFHIRSYLVLFLIYHILRKVQCNQATNFSIHEVIIIYSQEEKKTFSTCIKCFSNKSKQCRILKCICLWIPNNRRNQRNFEMGVNWQCTLNLFQSHSDNLHIPYVSGCHCKRDDMCSLWKYADTHIHSASLSSLFIVNESVRDFIVFYWGQTDQTEPNCRVDMRFFLLKRTHFAKSCNHTWTSTILTISLWLYHWIEHMNLTFFIYNTIFVDDLHSELKIFHLPN